MNRLIELIKNKPILSSAILVILSNAFTDFPLPIYLSEFIPFQNALMISIFILQMGCFGILLYLSKKLEISDTFNLTLRKPVKSLLLLIPFILLIIINIIDGMNFDLISNSPLVFILYSFAFLSTGFFEEILFRGIAFNLINKKFGSAKKGFYFSVLISNFIFGAAHIVHLLDGSVPLINFINQMFYAFVIGIVFSALYLRCNTLLIPILIHGLLDITGSTGFLSITSKELYLQSHIQPPITFNDIIGTLIIFLPLLIWGVFLLRKASPNNNTILENNLSSQVNE